MRYSTRVFTILPMLSWLRFDTRRSRPVGSTCYLASEWPPENPWKTLGKRGKPREKPWSFHPKCHGSATKLRTFLLRTSLADLGGCASPLWSICRQRARHFGLVLLLLAVAAVWFVRSKVPCWGRPVGPEKTSPDMDLPDFLGEPHSKIHGFSIIFPNSIGYLKGYTLFSWLYVCIYIYI